MSRFPRSIDIPAPRPFRHFHPKTKYATFHLFVFHISPSSPPVLGGLVLINSPSGYLHRALEARPEERITRVPGDARGSVHVTLALLNLPPDVITFNKAVAPASWRCEAGSTAVLDHTLRSQMSSWIQIRVRLLPFPKRTAPPKSSVRIRPWFESFASHNSLAYNTTL